MNLSQRPISKVDPKMSNENTQVVVLMVPFPAQGHINQLIHLSHLITTSGIQVHCAGSATHNHQAKRRVHGWDVENSAKIHFHDYQLPPFEHPPTDPHSLIKFPAHLEPLSRALSELRQPVYQLMQQLSVDFRRVVVIHDNLMASVVQDVTLIENAESYTFLSVSAFTIFFSKWETILKKPFELDVDVPSSIPTREGCFSLEFEKFIIEQHKLLEFESGRIFNTSRVIEGKYMELLRKLQTNSSKKLFAIGPFNPVEAKGSRSDSRRHRCLEWLDRQEKGSVIYVSFGSMTPMAEDQIKELAIGLEESEVKFIWVLRDADRGDGDSVVEDAARRSGPELPDGYEQRLRNRGMVIRDWAPQLEILEHPATGGFLSHCGWSSCMESMTMGVPIAAWPMHSDQPRNSILVTEELRIGTLVRDWADLAELVTSVAVRGAVRKLMASNEGEEMRQIAEELGDAVRKSVSNGGISGLELESFISHITR